MNQRSLERYLALSFLTFIAIITTVDIWHDYQEDTPSFHLAIEVILLVTCLIGLLYFWTKLLNEKNTISNQLLQTREDLQYWKKKSSHFIQGLSNEIDLQLDKWGLSKSEKEIALLLIKGLSTKEIADIRSTSEKTVRTQTSSIYRKANLTNRNELSAFFLEDLLLPGKKSKI